MSEYHGWSKGEDTFYVGHLPTRKGVALYNPNGDLYAYFKSEEMALKFVKLLDRMLQPQERLS